MAKKAASKAIKSTTATTKSKTKVSNVLNVMSELGQVKRLPLEELMFDLDNPRFGGRSGGKTEKQVLEYIFENFDLTDVLSSIAVNGFFASEPLIGVKQPNGKIKIVEGNRRLAACSLILKDSRAGSLSKRPAIVRFQDLWEQMGSKTITPLPVAVYDEEEESSFLAYLGVRHIQGSKTWDSYAKAAWIHSMVSEKQLDIDKIAEMIGDTSRITRRLLSAYYVSKQLEVNNLFDPDLSMKFGKGSCTRYPFSWTYTVLGNSGIREWLELPDDPDQKPLKSKESLNRAQELYVSMFGQKGKRKPAIYESRELTRLASVIVQPEGERLLRQGKPLEDVEDGIKDPRTRLEDSLSKAETDLEKCLIALGEGKLKRREAASLLDLGVKVSEFADGVVDGLQRAMKGE